MIKEVDINFFFIKNTEIGLLINEVQFMVIGITNKRL